MKRPKRVRKPKTIQNGAFCCSCGIQRDVDWIADNLDLKETKRLHSWLTKAIAYLEQEGK